MWHAFGDVGEWTEWHAWAPTMRAALEMAAPKRQAYGHAFVENPPGTLCWFADKLSIRPYKPLQSDIGVV